MSDSPRHWGHILTNIIKLKKLTMIFHGVIYRLGYMSTVLTTHCVLAQRKSKVEDCLIPRLPPIRCLQKTATHAIRSHSGY
jgi:hypothetical protein